MTPYNLYTGYSFVGNSHMYDSGAFGAYSSLLSERGLRPVINIRSDVLISSGDGTIDNPYHLIIQ